MAQGSSSNSLDPDTRLRHRLSPCTTTRLTVVRAVSQEQHRMSFCLREILEGAFGVYAQKSVVWKKPLMVFHQPARSSLVLHCFLQLLGRQTQSPSRKTEWLGLKTTPSARP